MSRNLTLDVLKILLACSVVGLHSGFLNETSATGHYLFENGIFRIAVPVFFVINGYFFYHALSRGLGKWVSRLATLYLIWMAAYAYAWFHFDLGNGLVIVVLEVILNLILGYWHLWFIVGSIGAGLMVYVLRELPDRLLIIFGGLLLLMGLSIQYAGNYHLFAGTTVDSLLNKTPLYRNFVFVGFPFFLIGYMASKHKWETLLTTRGWVFLTVLGFVLLLLEALMNLNLTNPPERFDILFSLVLICPALFLLAIKNPVPGRNKNLSHVATAIYLIHPMILHVIWRYVEIPGTLQTVITIILSSIAAFLLIGINRKLKVIL